MGGFFHLPNDRAVGLRPKDATDLPSLGAFGAANNAGQANDGCVLRRCWGEIM